MWFAIDSFGKVLASSTSLFQVFSSPLLLITGHNLDLALGHLNLHARFQRNSPVPL